MQYNKPKKWIFMSSSVGTTFDSRFSDWYYFLKYELEEYPVCLRPTVKKMRAFAPCAQERKVVIDYNDILGEGSYGKVYRGYYEPKMGERVVCAIKILTDPKLGWKECRHEADMLWRSAGNVYMVGLHGLFRPEGLGSPNALALDLIEGQTVKSLFLSLETRTFPIEELVELTRQLLDFLVQIQTVGPNRESPLIHGDLSGDSIFWHQGKLWVIDCSLMGQTKKLSKSIIQKALFRAPEIFLNQTSDDHTAKMEAAVYDEKVDMWSVGLILFELLTKSYFVKHMEKEIPYGRHEIASLVDRLGMPAASYLERMSQTERFFQKNLDGTFSLSFERIAEEKINSLELEVGDAGEFLDLLKPMLSWDPKLRPTPQQALQHPLFTKKLVAAV